MDNQNPPPITTTKKRRGITFDEVSQVLAKNDLSPYTNALKVRALLGNTGSTETIQRHLETLREELVKASTPPPVNVDYGDMPPEIRTAVWSIIMTAAKVETLARSEKLAAERDASMAEAERLNAEVQEVITSSDERITQLEDEISTLTVNHQSEVERLIQMNQDLQQRFEKLTDELEKTQSELLHEKMASEHEAKIAASNQAILEARNDKLMDQIGELKANLYNRADQQEVDRLITEVGELKSQFTKPKAQADAKKQ